MQDFKHRVALVTGASTGIGEAIAGELFRRGATVVMTGRHAVPLAAAAARLDPDGRRVMTLRMDVRDAPSVRQGIEEIVRRCGALHLIATCLSGTFFGMKYGLPAIVAGGGGAVVNLSSANGVVGIAGIAPYTAAKHGVLGLTRSAALEFATRGVRVNAVGPGYVDTPAMGKLPASARAQMAASHPMGRMATREEVAKTVAFLLSDDSSFTTGAFYSIDGGYTAR
jgi:NAD(P)-dependent dehydrogenase (short-subunit alcohol dehydrogenase family)